LSVDHFTQLPFEYQLVDTIAQVKHTLIGVGISGAGRKEKMNVANVHSSFLRVFADLTLRS